MTKREKLRQKLRNNPKSATMQEVETLLTSFGFKLVRTQGSHHIFEYDDGKISKQIVVPLHGRKVKAVYVKKAVELVDAILPKEVNEGDSASDESPDGETNDD